MFRCKGVSCCSGVQRGLVWLRLGGVGRFQNSGGGLGVQGFGDSKVLGLGSGAKAGRFVIR